MLVEGICLNGHPVLCSMREGRLSGALVAGALRSTCPKCGAEVEVKLESGSLPVSRPSEPRRDTPT